MIGSGVFQSGHYKTAKNYRKVTYYMQNDANVTQILTIFDTHLALRHASSRCVEHPLNNHITLAEIPPDAETAKNYRKVTYYMQNHVKLKGPFTYYVTPEGMDRYQHKRDEA